MSVHPPSAVDRPGSRSPRDDAILFAVMDDMRHTLRTSWIDPALRSVSSHPLFFTAAWAATKPNMTRSFALGTEQLRLAAIDAVRAIHSVGPPVRAGNGTGARTALALRRRLPGTGQEEPPAKRGIPSWQEGLGTMPRSLPSEAEALVDDATIGLGLTTTPFALQAIAAWPRFLEESWRRLLPATRSLQWTDATAGLRRRATDVLRSLPHPMDLQWDVLGRRGLTEDRREALGDHLAMLGAAMPVNMLVAAHLWVVLGSPEPPGDAG